MEIRTLHKHDESLQRPGAQGGEQNTTQIIKSWITNGYRGERRDECNNTALFVITVSEWPWERQKGGGGGETGFPLCHCATSPAGMGAAYFSTIAHQVWVLDKKTDRTDGSESMVPEQRAKTCY